MTDVIQSIPITIGVDLTALALQLAEIPSFVTAVAAAMPTTTTTPPVTPPPVTGDLIAPANLPAGPYTLSGTPGVVFVDGQLNWPAVDDMSYGSVKQGMSIVVSPTDPNRKVLQVVTSDGTGGWQPAYQNPPSTPNYLPAAGYKFFNIDIYQTMPSDTFLLTFDGPGDTPIPAQPTIRGIEAFLFAGAFVVGAWARIKVPVNLANSILLKFGLQEDKAMPGNRYLIDNCFFSTT